MFLYTSVFGSGNLGGGGPTGDPHIANVVLLCGFEGSDGSTTFTDESPSGHTLTANGNAQIDTAQAAVGSASSALFDASGDYVSAPDSADFHLSAANSDQFTIEFFIRKAVAGSNKAILSQAGGNGSAGWYVTTTWALAGGDGINPMVRVDFTFSLTGGLAGNLVATTGTATLLTWTDFYHVAIGKNSSGKIRIHLNGALHGSSTPANSAFFNSPSNLEIGRNLSSNATALDGWIDELRITKGVCRYDTDGAITVPTAPFPRS